MQHRCLTATALGTVLECWLQDTQPVELAVLQGMVLKRFGTAARQQQPAALPSLQHAPRFCAMLSSVSPLRRV